MKTEVAVRENLPEGADDPGGLIRFALQNNTPVEVLERLVALQERVTDRNARAEYFEALARVQDEVPAIKKNQTAKIATKGGSSYSYTFAPLDQITKVVRPTLKRHGFSFNWTTEGTDNGSLNVICVLRHVAGHEERSAFPVPIDTAAAMSGAQKNGAALTYGKRQSLTSVLGLTTTDDDTDGAEPAQYIDRNELADLEALVEEVGADVDKFLSWLGVAHLNAVTKDQLPAAIKALERKRT